MITLSTKEPVSTADADSTKSASLCEWDPCRVWPSWQRCSWPHPAPSRWLIVGRQLHVRSSWTGHAVRFPTQTCNVARYRAWRLCVHRMLGRMALHLQDRRFGLPQPNMVVLDPTGRWIRVCFNRGCRPVRDIQPPLSDRRVVAGHSRRPRSGPVMRLLMRLLMCRMLGVCPWRPLKKLLFCSGFIGSRSSSIVRTDVVVNYNGSRRCGRTSDYLKRKLVNTIAGADMVDSLSSPAGPHLSPSCALVGSRVRQGNRRI